MSMTYKKPKDVRYVDMCIYIDKAVADYDPVTNPFTIEQEENIYIYMYHLYYNFACRERYFNKVDDYDEYALFCATKAWQRITNQDKPKLKSILNYVKKTKYGWKRKWQRENYQVILSDKYTPGFDSVTFRENYQKTIKNSNKDLAIEQVIGDIDLIPIELKSIINDTPYCNDRLMCKHLYISVLMSYLYEIDEILQSKNINKYLYKYVNKIKLWRLDPSMTGLVNVLLNKLKVRMASHVRVTLGRYELSDKEVDDIIIRNYNVRDDDGREINE